MRSGTNSLSRMTSLPVNTMAHRHDGVTFLFISLGEHNRRAVHLYRRTRPVGQNNPVLEVPTIQAPSHTEPER